MSANTSIALDVPLARVLERHRDRRFLFVEPGGNWGDSLIYLGAETLARRIGLQWERLTYGDFLERPPTPDVAVYVHGGGGFNTFCSGRAPAAFLHAVKHYPGEVVLGPTTVDDADGFVDATLLPGLKDLRAREVVFFVREWTSLKVLAGRLPAGISLHLDHDTAFQLTAEEALQGRREANRYVLLALREDDEAPVGFRGDGLAGVRLDPAFYGRSFDHWLRIHALASEIITNRTHSSILGAVLQKPTTLLGGGYHKNRSIWECSLATRGVRWIDWTTFETPVRRRRISGIDRIAGSWKVQRTLKRLRGVPWA